MSGSSRSSDNGAYFYQGKTADGKSYYKSSEKALYLFYDSDCDAKGRMLATWLLRTKKPSTTLTEDLDDDGICAVDGMYKSVGDAGSDSPVPPLGDHVWNVHNDSGGKW